ncbi:DEAD/DEAH box helicase [Gallionella capsiferriformans]|uniref:Type III restriction protein res subunit n=1 Tax=Gallionella capsiferriformans (strain ES-2) TaxID=395494 RepID=D9SD34_GALCS|nr:helicase-related protein [Gallionella capsiferriformans]ADL54723.1 type III restriction protein res subunit [Gallionella capsiferriformans ES-2]
MTRLVEHLARSETSELAPLLGSSTVELLSKLGPEATSPAGLAYFIVSLHGKRGALRRQDIRGLLLSKLDMSEATQLCHQLQLPVISPLQALSGLNFDAAPGNLELLERWYGLVDDDVEAPLQASEGSHKVIASHKLHPHQLNAFRKLLRAIAHPPCSALVHMPFGAGKLRLVATAALDLYRSDADDRSIIWLAPGTAMCEEAFLELQEVWQQLGSRDTTILRLYGEHPTRDLDQLGGAIAVIDILRLSKDDPALEKLGAFTSVAVFADAESLIHPVGAEIVRRMSAGGHFSVVGILATSGAAIPTEPAQSALKAAFSDAWITVAAEDELQLLREAGDFASIDATVVHLTNHSTTSAPLPVNHDSLDFDHSYVTELSNSVERNERIMEVLKKEAGGRGRIIYYATTAENARLFAGLLPVQGVKARSVTAEESPAERALALQRFVAREERVLCVHGFLLSGISVPDISVCLMASPCKSRATFLSMIGRLVQARTADLQTLRLIVAADSQADTGWVGSLSTWSPLNT